MITVSDLRNWNALTGTIPAAALERVLCRALMLNQLGEVTVNGEGELIHPSGPPLGGMAIDLTLLKTLSERDRDALALFVAATLIDLLNGQDTLSERVISHLIEDTPRIRRLRRQVDAAKASAEKFPALVNKVTDAEKALAQAIEDENAPEDAQGIIWRGAKGGKGQLAAELYGHPRYGGEYLIPGRARLEGWGDGVAIIFIDHDKPGTVVFSDDQTEVIRGATVVFSMGVKDGKFIVLNAEEGAVWCEGWRPDTTTYMLVDGALKQLAPREIVQIRNEESRK